MNEKTNPPETGPKPEKFQLCRMILINAGTNLHVPSGRITAIDPRGGAAVLGDNGVGKTTTLRILPLFFGHLPSQIVAAGHGQEAMVRFVIPTDASAIAFEYQRGSDDESSLRLAVIRRRSDDPDVPFYRLYRSGFRQELFVSEGRFLSDEETQQKATELGIATTSKLTTSEYRSVILRVPSNSKDKEKLRRYSLDWSYGPKQLDNMDRIVAAMVKKHINFADIVQVAVGLVQHDLGQGAERAKLSFKQGREPIERWLRNREACIDAMQRAPAFKALDEELNQLYSAKERYRSCRSDVRALVKAREEEADGLATLLDNMADARTIQLQKEDERKRLLQEHSATCSRAFASAKEAAEQESARASSFETQGAARWELLVQELPVLRANLHTAQAQVEAAQTHHQQATAHYNRLEHEARTRANDDILALESSKENHRKRLTESMAGIVAAENEALRLCDDEFAAKRQRLDEDKEPLLEQRGRWENLKKNPSASSEAQLEVDEAGVRLQKKTEEAAIAQRLCDQRLRDQERARAAFAAQEGEVSRARAGVHAAQEKLAQAKARLNPPQGTLLAALRAHGGGTPHRNLARVINPELLQRDDLDPTLVEECAETVYGWRINTAAITVPDWADDSLARASIEAAQEHLARAQSALESQLANLESKGAQLKDLDAAAQDSQAKVSVLNAQTQECKNRLETARSRIASERKNAISLAEDQLRTINAKLESLKHQRAALDRDHSIAKAAIRQTHERLKSEANSLCKNALSSIDESVAKVKADLSEALVRLDAQLKEHLSKEGVDVARLNALKDDLQKLRGQVQEREDHRPLVDRWKAWLEAGGPARLEALKAAAQRAAQASRDAARQHSEHLQAMQASAAEYEAAVADKTKRQKQVWEELETLQQLDLSFEDYGAAGTSVIDTSTPASALKAKARAIRSDIERLEANITKAYSTLHQALTTRNSTVKDLVEASMAEVKAKDITDRAKALCICYRQIGPQVANDVNITLKALLQNIGAFHKAIQSFEREVGSFNRRLQAGLSEVKCFDRVKDLRLDIVTNFDGLGFYKKLSRMEDVVREHATEVGKDYSRELPSDDTARALSEFMSVLGSDGNVEVNLSQHITLRGSISDNGRHKEFKRASELEGISSEGLTSLVLITLMTALLNTIRGAEPVHVPWVTDEVGKFDPNNFRALMQRLRDNLIDVVTASPELGPAQQAMFAQRYLFEDRGRIREYRPMPSRPQLGMIQSSAGAQS